MKFYKQIFIFNRPFFNAAAIIILAGAALLCFANFSFPIRIILVAGLISTAYLSIGSLFFSHLIYDLSDLYKYNWLKPFVKNNDVAFNLFSGYSESAHMLGKEFGSGRFKHIDFYEEAVSVTSSIKIAKALSQPIENVSINFADWGSVGNSSLILFMQSLHELRPMKQKIACLKEAAAHLEPGGLIIIAEHLCDWKNFLIYGPGAFHFFGNKHWEKAISLSGLQKEKVFHVTPFIKIFVLKN